MSAVAAAAPPFLLIPSSPSSRRTPAASSVSSSHRTPTPTPRTQAALMPTYRAPAHAHAHHLHSIPQREKSTRSLIVDSMLDQLTEVRLGQVRAELGADVVGDAEGVEALRRWEFYTGVVRTEHADDDNHPNWLQILNYAQVSQSQPKRPVLRVPNASLALTLRARAQGITNVVHSMLTQPPTPAIPLPNHLRIRLSLAILYELLFAPPTLLPTKAERDKLGLTQNSVTEIPAELAQLVPISNVLPPAASPAPSQSLPSLQSIFPLPSPKTSFRPVPSNSPPVSAFRSFGVSSSHPPPSPISTARSPAPTSHPTPAPTSASSNASAPPVFSWSRPTNNRTTSHQPTSSMPTSIEQPKWGPPSSKFKPSAPPSLATSLFQSSIESSSPLCARHLASLNTPSPCLSCSLIPRSARSTIGSGLPNSRLSNLLSLSDTAMPSVQAIERFLRISALICMELSGTTSTRPTRAWYALLASLLSRAVVEGYVGRGWKGIKGVEVLCSVGSRESYRTTTLPPVSASASAINTRDRDGRSRSGSIVDRMDEDDQEDEDDDDEESNADGAEFDPDGFPTLKTACEVLFQPTVAPGVSDPWAEFRTEMKRRKDEFLSSASDNNPTSLVGHFSALRNIYAFESTELTLLAFCEALNTWRGVPELLEEPPRSASRSSESSRSATPSTAHPTPSSTTNGKSSTSSSSYLSHFFAIPRSRTTSQTSSSIPSKRFRSLSIDSESGSGEHGKRSRRERSPRPGADWVGPYGV